jgi:hypothetical protein
VGNLSYSKPPDGNEEKIIIIKVIILNAMLSFSFEILVLVSLPCVPV